LSRGLWAKETLNPNATSTLNFRRLLEQHQLIARLSAAINAHLVARGLLVGRGTIVDVGFIDAPPSTNDVKSERDPQTLQTRQGQQWYFGMKVHTGTDTKSGLVYTLQATAANVGEVNVLGELLHDGKECLHGDSACPLQELQAPTEATGIAFNVSQRGSTQRRLTKAQRARNGASRGRAPWSIIRSSWSSGCGVMPRCVTAGSRRTWRRCTCCSSWPMCTACEDGC
jgi:IS5 family transposase